MAELSLLVRGVKNALKSLGLDLVRYRPNSHPEANRFEQMRKLGVDVVLDVGANIGQYARHVRERGYRGVIHSFEPLQDAFRSLEKSAQADTLWQAHNYALGSEEKELEINLSESSASSSLLAPTESSIALHSSMRTVDKEVVKVKRLDQVFAELCEPESHVLLKIDTQGFEKEVLLGGQESLEKIELLQVEMTFAPLYEGQPLFDELYGWVCQQGFHLTCFEGAWWDLEKGAMMQVDGIFRRN